MTNIERKRKQRRRLKQQQRMNLAPLDAAQRYEVEEAGAYLRISRQTVYNLIGAGELRIIKEGARTFVPGSEIIRRSALPAA